MTALQFTIQIESIAVSGWCVDALDGNQQKRIGLFSCAQDRIFPHTNQDFALSYFRDIRIRNDYRCWDANPSDVDVADDRIPIKLNLCHTLQGNQFFRYDHVSIILCQAHKVQALETLLDQQQNLR